MIKIGIWKKKNLLQEYNYLKFQTSMNNAYFALYKYEDTPTLNK